MSLLTNVSGGIASNTNSIVHRVTMVNLVKPLRMHRWLIPLLLDYSLAALAFVIAGVWGWVAYPVSILLLGIAQHRIAILGHDAAHGLICRNKKVNNLLGQLLCFWPLLFDIDAYRKFHWDHHRHTGADGLDPEMHLKQDNYHLPITKKQLYGRFLFDMIGGSIKEFVNLSVYMGKRSKPLWALSFMALAFTASYYAGHVEFFALYMISKPTAFWAVFRMRIYTEHTELPVDGTHRLHLSLWQRFLFAPHYTWMHWEHHQHPHVPFWQLPALRLKYNNVPVISFNDLLNWNKRAKLTGLEEEMALAAMDMQVRKTA